MLVCSITGIAGKLPKVETSLPGGRFKYDMSHLHFPKQEKKQIKMSHYVHSANEVINLIREEA